MSVCLTLPSDSSDSLRELSKTSGSPLTRRLSMHHTTGSRSAMASRPDIASVSGGNSMRSETFIPFEATGKRSQVLEDLRREADEPLVLLEREQHPRDLLAVASVDAADALRQRDLVDDVDEAAVVHLDPEPATRLLVLVLLGADGDEGPVVGPRAHHRVGAVAVVLIGADQLHVFWIVPHHLPPVGVVCSSTKSQLSAAASTAATSTGISCMVVLMCGSLAQSSDVTIGCATVSSDVVGSASSSYPRYSRERLGSPLNFETSTPTSPGLMGGSTSTSTTTPPHKILRYFTARGRRTGRGSPGGTRSPSGCAV